MSSCKTYDRFHLQTGSFKNSRMGQRISPLGSSWLKFCYVPLMSLRERLTDDGKPRNEAAQDLLVGYLLFATFMIAICFLRAGNLRALVVRRVTGSYRATMISFELLAERFMVTSFLQVRAGSISRNILMR